jgi:uncharacterized membrane protein YtjA (UPF0391 family)
VIAALEAAEHLFQRRIIAAGEAQSLSLRRFEKSFSNDRILKSGVTVMLSWVVTFLIVALVAGILGFGGIAGVSIEIAKTIFFIAVVLFLVSAVVGLARGRTRV